MALIREDERVYNKKVDMHQKKDIIDLVQGQRSAAAEKTAEMKEQKKEIRDQIHDDITEALKRRKEEDLIDLKKKEELIR